MRHKFEPTGGMKENPGVFDNGNGGLSYTAQCACGITRKRGEDYTNARSANNWGPHYFDADGKRLHKLGPCTRVEPIDRQKLQALIDNAHALRNRFENALGEIEKFIGVDVEDLGEIVGELDADDLLHMVDKQ